MNRLKLLIVALTLPLTLTGCGEETYTPVEGTVVSKYDSFYFMLVGKVNVPQYYYEITVAPKDGGAEQVWDVYSTVYDSCNETDQIVRSQDGTVVCTEVPR